MKYIKEMGLLVFLLTFIATVSVWTSAKANCTGCGEEGMNNVYRAMTIIMLQFKNMDTWTASG